MHTIEVTKPGECPFLTTDEEGLFCCNIDDINCNLYHFPSDCPIKNGEKYIVEWRGKDNGQ